MTEGVLHAADGLAVAYRSWPGTATATALYIHATGFCKEVWDPVAEALTAAGSGIGGMAIDQRGHGDSGLPASFHWSALGGDAALARAAIDGPVVGVGHSSGGAALCMAEAAAPGTFLALVLIEPIIFPGPHTRVEDGPMSERAMRRRRSFDSIDEALSHLSGRPTFAAWTPSALEAYVRHGFHEDEAGQWALKCLPESEAEFYREGTNHDTWEHLPAIRCPVVVLAGERSETHPQAVVERLVARFPAASLHIVAGATHFVPMERPAVVAAAIAQMAA